MKLYSILLFQKAKENLEIRNEGYNLSHVSFFYRRTIKEFIVFYSKIVAQNIQNQKICVIEKEYKICAENKNDFTVVVATDKEYPDRAIFSIIDSVWKEMNKDINLNKMVDKYQDPCEVDKIMKIQRDIDTTKMVMLDAVDKILQRGEKIDDLILKSQDLSDSSKEFHKKAEKMNSWCCVLA
jgi:synaptobrevin family protein YKT6